MDIHTLSAHEILAHLNSGEITSEETVQALIDRSHEVDPAINAFCHRFDQQALEEARTLDKEREDGSLRGPLHGLPISVKENVNTKGVPSSLGMTARLGTAAKEDAVSVRIARELGAIVLGKTNVPQTLLSPMETTNRIWGTTNNPWKLTHGPGGSSGGEGAAIASGQSPLGIGTDIGGSIRFPAGFCGVAGIKPTNDRWSNLGSSTAISGQEVIRAQIGPMARTTRDLILAMTAMNSGLHHQHDPRVPPLPFADPNSIDVSGLRIGYYEDDGFFTPAGSVQRAVREAVELLEAAGATVVPFSPPNASDVVYLMFEAVSGDGAKTLDAAMEGEEIIDPLKLVQRVAHLPASVRKAAARTAHLMGESRIGRMLDCLGEKSVQDLWAITSRRSEYQRLEHEAWRSANIDALVCPMHVTPAIPQGMSKDFTLSFCYSARYNVLNLPAGVVPITRVKKGETERPQKRDRLDKRAAEVEKRSQGLPVPVQVVGRPFHEPTVLAVMQAIEDRARTKPDFPWTPVNP